MEKYIFAILMGIIVTTIICIPFFLIIIGFTIAATSNFWFGTLLIILNLIILRLIKPISILTHKDWKIF